MFRRFNELRGFTDVTTAPPQPGHIDEVSMMTTDQFKAIDLMFHDVTRNKNTTVLSHLPKPYCVMIKIWTPKILILICMTNLLSPPELLYA